MASEPRTVDLSGVRARGGAEFVNAELWDDEHQFVIVIARSPDQTLSRLRLDLYKQAFLDHAEDLEADELIRAQTLPVWNVVVEAMRER